MVTVLMTVYNEGEKTLKKSIESILNQTYCKFDLLIIIDNPENLSAIKAIKNYSELDDRIKYVINEKNLGLPISLNKGIDLIKTKYIARMDADDIAISNRLQVQLEYMEKNKSIDLVGSNIIYFNEDISFKRSPIPQDAESIKKILKVCNVMSHPTFFGKTEVFRKLKYRNLKYSQDYDFICRLIEKGYNVCNIDQYLLKYYFSQNNPKKELIQRIIMLEVQKQYRRNTLNDCDIQNIIFNKVKMLKENDYVKFHSSKIYYDKVVTYKKKKKYFNMVYCICMSFFTSRYQRRHIFNMMEYALLIKNIM